MEWQEVCDNKYLQNLPSETRLNIIEEEIVASIAPEICVELKSASNTLQEIVVKKDLYFAAQAQEIWLCNEQG